METTGIRDTLHTFSFLPFQSRILLCGSSLPLTDLQPDQDRLLKALAFSVKIVSPARPVTIGSS